MDFKTLEFEIQNGVGYLTLNRPKAANAINLQMGRDLMEAALYCDENPAVRAILIRATGKMFCSGGDLGSFSEAHEDLPRQLKELTTYLHAAISRFARGNAPVIAAVGGAAAGAGFSLVTAADLVVASQAARFTLAYTQIGLSPDGSSTYFLPRIVGKRRALELMLTNRVLSADEALDWGLVNQVVPDEELEAISTKLAQRLAAGPTLAFGRTKRLLAACDPDGLETQMELEARAIADSARSQDAKAGIAAFLSKERASFQGE
jgi:2-(1,2-epoxy-1,2-dihydrophenyl)acetyl-CoA isomerase